MGLRFALAPLRSLSGVEDVRIKGAIGVVQIDASQQDMFALRPQFIQRGVWIRPFSNCVYLMPPLVISTAQLSKLTCAIKDVLEAWSSQRSAA